MNLRKSKKKKPRIKSKKIKKTLERKEEDIWLNLPKIPDLPKPKIDTRK